MPRASQSTGNGRTAKAKSGKTRSGKVAPRSPLFIGSTEKAFQVLHAFDGPQRHMTLADIARAAGLDRSATQRLVYTLEQPVESQGSEAESTMAGSAASADATQGATEIKWRCSPHFQNTGLYPAIEFFKQALAQSSTILAFDLSSASPNSSIPIRVEKRGFW